MSKSVLFGIAGLCAVASIIMFVVGSNSGHLSELKDFFWAPLPLAIICGIGGMKKQS